MCKLLAPVLLHKPLAKQHYWLLTKKNTSDKSRNFIWKEVNQAPVNPETHSYACWLPWALCLRSQPFLIPYFMFWLFLCLLWICFAAMLATALVPKELFQLTCMEIWQIFCFMHKSGSSSCLLCSPPAILAANIFATSYPICQGQRVSFKEQEPPHEAQRNPKMSLLQPPCLPHWFQKRALLKFWCLCGEPVVWFQLRQGGCTLVISHEW